MNPMQLQPPIAPHVTIHHNHDTPRHRKKLDSRAIHGILGLMANGYPTKGDNGIMTTETAEETTTATQAPDMDALKKAVSSARTAHTKAEKAATEARASDDVDFDALMALMDAVKSSTRTLAKAESAVSKAEFEAGAAERGLIVDNVTSDLVDALGRHLEAIGRTKITGFSIRIEDGNILVDATVPGTPGRKGGARGRGRTRWTLNDVEYTSREFLDQIGRATDGFDIDTIFEKASTGGGAAGFDAHVKRLAKETGAKGIKTDGTMVDLG